MKWHSSLLLFCKRACVGIIIPGLMTVAARADEINVYRVPKESAPKTALPSGHPDTTHSHDVSAPPKFSYTRPEGWVETGSGEMRVLGFNISGPADSHAQVAITPLGDMAGKEAIIVNMWRQQVGLGELSPENAAKELTPVNIGGDAGKLFEIAGKSPKGEAIKIITAMMSRSGTSWFYKLQGDDALVTAQKSEFIAFLKSMKLSDDAPALSTLPGGHPPVGNTPPFGSQPAAPVTPREGGPNWTVPSGWTEVSGGSFLFAKFTMAGEGGTQAAVNVSTSAGDGGGLAANVGRWLGQIGKSPWSESDLKQNTTEIEVAGGRAVFVEMSGTDARTGQPAMIIGATTSQKGQAWFYKLMGDPKTVTSQREAFTKFVKEVKY